MPLIAKCPRCSSNTPLRLTYYSPQNAYGTSCDSCGWRSSYEIRPHDGSHEKQLELKGVSSMLTKIPTSFRCRNCKSPLAFPDQPGPVTCRCGYATSGDFVAALQEEVAFQMNRPAAALADSTPDTGVGKILLDAGKTGLKREASRIAVEQLVKAARAALGDSYPRFLDTPLGRELEGVIVCSALLWLCKNWEQLPSRQLFESVAVAGIENNSQAVARLMSQALLPICAGLAAQLGSLPGTSDGDEPRAIEGESAL